MKRYPFYSEREGRIMAMIKSLVIDHKNESYWTRQLITEGHSAVAVIIQHLKSEPFVNDNSPVDSHYILPLVLKTITEVDLPIDTGASWIEWWENLGSKQNDLPAMSDRLKEAETLYARIEEWRKLSSSSYVDEASGHIWAAVNLLRNDIQSASFAETMAKHEMVK